MVDDSGIVIEIFCKAHQHVIDDVVVYVDFFRGQQELSIFFAVIGAVKFVGLGDGKFSLASFFGRNVSKARTLEFLLVFTKASEDEDFYEICIIFFMIKGNQLEDDENKFKINASFEL